MLDSLKPYSDRGNEAGRFWIVKSTSRFFRRSPSVNNPGEFRKALTAAEKYQYHLKSNASCAGSGFGSMRRAQLLTRFKSSMGAKPRRGRKTASGCKQGKFRPKLLNRSEEHTSELQSPCNLVCRLL